MPAHRADLIKLANVATRQAAAYALLAAAAGAWAAEAAFLVLLAIGQRLRLLAIASYVRGKAWMIYTIENLFILMSFADVYRYKLQNSAYTFKMSVHVPLRSESLRHALQVPSAC